MLCKKCQAEIQPESAVCTKCGTPVSAEQTKAQVPKSINASSVVAMLSSNTRALTIGGCFLVILGSFLPWISVSSYHYSVLGVVMSQGAVTLMAGVLCLAALVLAPSDSRRKRGIFLIILGALMLALIFQSLYYIKDNHMSIGAGWWISMVGVFLTVGAGGFDTGVFENIATKASRP